MKVLIFGLPRSGSTVLQRQLGFHFGLENLSEPFAGADTNIQDTYLLLENKTQYIIKVLSVHLGFIDINKILDNNFDLIVLLSRKNLADCCISLYYAEQVAKQYHYTENIDINKISPFECPGKFVDQWISQYVKYKEIENAIECKYVTEKIFYEDYYQGITQKILDKEVNINTVSVKTVSPEIPYDKVCLNYQDIKEKLKHL